MSRSFGARPLTTWPPMRDLAGGDILQPGQHAQQCGLAAAGRPDENDEFAIGNFDIDALDNRMRSE